MDDVWTTIIERSYLPPEVYAAAISEASAMLDTDGTVNYDQIIDEVDGMRLTDGSRLDLGSDYESDAIRAIKGGVRKWRSSLT